MYCNLLKLQLALYAEDFGLLVGL